MSRKYTLRYIVVWILSLLLNYLLRNCGKGEYCIYVLHIDLEKAHDRVNWEAL